MHRRRTGYGLYHGWFHIIPVSYTQVVIKPGDRIPVDGEIISGHSSVDESLLTGESIPVEKETGDHVICGSINKTGAFKFRATKIGDDTTPVSYTHLDVYKRQELHYQRTSGSVFGAEHGEAGAVGSVPRGRTDPPLRSGLAVPTQAVSEVA